MWVTRSTGWFKRMQAGVLESTGFCKRQHVVSKHRNNQKVPQVLGMSCVFLPLRAGQKCRHLAVSYFSKG